MSICIDVLVTVFQYHAVNESLFKSIASNEGNDSVVGALSHGYVCCGAQGGSR